MIVRQSTVFFNCGGSRIIHPLALGTRLRLARSFITTPNKNKTTVHRRQTHAHPKPDSNISASTSNTTPLLIYKSAPQNGFAAASYIASILPAACGIFEFYTVYLYPLPGTPQWISVTLGAVSILALGFGVRCLLVPFRLVRRIRAIRLTGTNSSSNSGTKYALEIETRRLLPVPWRTYKTIMVPADRVTLNHKLFATPMNSVVSRSGQFVPRFASKDVNNRKSLLQRGFENMRRAFTLQDVIYMTIEGRYAACKLDVGDGGWAYDHGRLLDKLVKHRQ